MKRIVSFLLLFVFLLTACATNSYQTIDTNKALELIDDGAVIIDVRTVEEFNREHIPNAVNIPLDDIETVGYDKATTLIIYCQTGIRSKEAVQKLVNLGYTSLYNLDGGLLNWGGSLEE